MTDSDLLERYNYDSFVPEKFQPWLNFNSSPPLGRIAPDFPLWQLDEAETSLKTVLSRNDFTIVEFGSFT
jgi:hypothetical protein